MNNQHSGVKSIFYLFYFLIPISIFSQNTPSVKGTVIDEESGEGISYASIQAGATNTGVSTDINGHFFLKLDDNINSLKISAIGYKTITVKIAKGKYQELTIKLAPSSFELSEVEVKVSKYKNKGNPAVELIKKVLENKEKNRRESFDYFHYEKYEKVDMAYNNITEGTRKSLLFRNIDFVFNFADTNKTTGKVYLPFFFREALSDVYFRKDPKAEKEYIHGEFNTVMPGVFDNIGIASFIQNLSQPVDIYDNAINLVTVDFISPLSPIAPNIYRFYILDTSVIKETPMVHMYFAPRFKSDKAFMGNMWIALDSTYAVRRIELGIPKEINLNWVNEMQITQEFSWVETDNIINGVKHKSRGLMVSQDDLFMDFAITKNEESKSILGSKKVSYRNITLNNPIPDSVFRTKVKTFRDEGADEKTEEFWKTNRHDTLSRQQKNIVLMVDSLGKNKPFQRMMKIGRLVLEGYTSVGKINIGPANTFYSFNEIEGFRGRIGGRTNTLFSKRMVFEGYAAYGFKDKKWKGFGGLRYSFPNQNVLKFPYNQIQIWYQDEIRIPGQDLNFVQEDNFLLSFKRGVNNKMIYNELLGLEYTKEAQNGFSYAISFKKGRQRPAGVLKFEYLEDGETVTKNEIKTSEFGLTLRYAPNEQFYQTSLYRVPILNKYPIFTFNYSVGLNGLLDGEYDYHNLNLKIQKLFYLSPIGYSKVSFEAGKIFGNVPYPLLAIHRANQTYSYQFESYNLMNFLEFVSDQYVSLHIFHNFEGILFNRIPLISKLKLREVATFKALVGSLDAKNDPLVSQGVFQFPVDNDGKSLTYSLEKAPYMEASVGIANIFKFFRVDYILRLSYLNHPGISKSGIRARFKIEF